MSQPDLSLNRVYWKYKGGSFMRPEHYSGVEVSCPKFHMSNKGLTIRNDMVRLAYQFDQLYRKDYKYVLASSGGIDSEMTAETFYNIKIPFRVLSLDLFNGRNKGDYIYAYDYCKERNIEWELARISITLMSNQIVPKAVELGQFSDSLSQAVLTHLFSYVKEDEILVFSGHNPDYHNEFGFGWWEDSPNLVKFAINAKKNFFTFTSLEPIFLHYMENFDANQPGNKDNEFIYKKYPNLKYRTKLTGWEVCHDIEYEHRRLLPQPTWKDTEDKVHIFITWK